LANERLESRLVNLFSLVDVDRSAHVSVETRVEETGRILQKRALGEGKLRWRILPRVSPRQSPSSAIRLEMSSAADWPWLAPDFFMFSS
jgi:hypothetical protein